VAEDLSKEPSPLGPVGAQRLEVELHGRFVRLEPLRFGHVRPLSRAATEDRATYGFTYVPATETAMAQAVATALGEEAAGSHLPFAIVATTDDRVVGWTRFSELLSWAWPPGSTHQRHGLPDAVEIGHTFLAASVQRSAVNTETKLLMIEHAFETWGVHRVRLRTDVRNARSRAAIERLGASFDGVLRADRPGGDDSVRDSACYSIVAAEWPAVRARLASRVRRST